MVKIDLHLHTTFSDGRLSPTELVSLCAERHIEIMAITDHDSTEGIYEALEASKVFPELTVVPGIELSTDIPGSEIHILGYFVDYENQEFQQMLIELRDGREKRARRMVQNLESLGINVSWNRVVELSDGGAIGRPHIAHAMVEAGIVQYPKEAFDLYLGRNGPVYSDRLKLTPVEAVKTLVKNGALPVLAHPTYTASKSDRGSVKQLEKILLELKSAGLIGMEVYYGDYGSDVVNDLASLAKNLELIPCGGSDYHAAGNPDEPEPGMVGPPSKTFTDLQSLYNSTSRKNNRFGSKPYIG